MEDWKVKSLLVIYIFFFKLRRLVERKELYSSSSKYFRFGSDIKQFCSNACLEDYKKGLKVCSYCQKDISGLLLNII